MMMMINIQYSIPRQCTLAFSGGVDSVAVASFLSANHDVTLLHVDHGTENGARARLFAEQYAEQHGHALEVHDIDRDVPAGVSQEEHWRNQRYKIFHAVDAPVLTCHHLDDCVETWIWSSLHGKGHVIAYCNLNVIRPFRLTRKSAFINWCQRRDISWIEDESNLDTKYTRNYIRHEMMPHVLRVNPGIHKVVAKKIKQDRE